jgi:ABC-2 type transport system permease protein
MSGGVLGSARRVGAMVMRHYYLIRGSWARILDLFYWPMVQVLLWGFISQFIAASGATGFLAQAGSVLLSAALLWEIMFRSQISLNMSFLEELWSRHLGHLMVSPLRPWELALSLFATSLIRTIIGFAPASLFAALYFDVSVYAMGFAFFLFFLNLVIMGWGIGIALAGIVLRVGMGAEGLIWAFVFALAPLSGIYYPVSILPDWCQAISAVLPSAQVFEGMRGILLDGVIRYDLLGRAAALNIVYLAGGLALFLLCDRLSRKSGRLMQLGE